MIKEYGEHDTAKMLEQIGTFAIFRVEGRTAKWAAEKFGDLELRRLAADWEKKSIHTENEQFFTSRAMFGSEFADMRPPSPETGLPGIYLNRFTRPFYANLFGLERLRPRPMAGVKPFEPRPQSDEDMRPWTLRDLRRLGIQIAPEDDLTAILGVMPAEEAVAAPTRQGGPSATPEADEYEGVVRLKLRKRTEGPPAGQD